MPSVSQHYGLTGPLEFLDVDVVDDNRLYVDPHAVRLERGPSPFAAQATKCLTTFFDEIVECVISPKRAETERGRGLLSRFHEPRETRLGMSQEGVNGHGGADDVGGAIWKALSTNAKALISVGVLKWVEDIPIFVYGVDKDITSDLTTRIIFEPLAKFTQAMMRKYPQFTQGSHYAKTFSRQIWSPSQKRWVFKKVELPVAEDIPLILVPKRWARPGLLMSGGRYYKTSMLSYVQELRGVIDPETGELVTEPKWRLEERKEFEQGLKTIMRVTREAHVEREDLLARFREFVDRRYEPLDDDEIDKRLRR
ncbi:MAG TPA: hypothetical protein VIS95_03740 [Solirubrobacterales bacterium]